jgi:DNA-binding transcriptional MerR regulator
VSEELLSIGRFAAMSRLTVKALRHYDAEGVLRPALIDPVTGYRSYRREQLRDALAVALLRSLGVPLPAVREVLGDRAALAGVLDRERARLAGEAARATRALAVVEALLRVRTLTPQEVDEVTEPDRWVVWRHGTVDAERLDRETLALIEALLADVADTDPPVVGVFPAVLEGRVPVSVGIEVPPPAALLPGGRFARVRHAGSHEELPLAYHALFAWLGARALPAGGPFRERYHGEGLTDVLHPLP